MKMKFGTYKVISSCLIEALIFMGIDASFAASDYRQNGTNILETLCFSEPFRFELLVGGRKICGSAQVRTKNAFLQHGSLLMSFEPDRAVQVLCPDPSQDLSDKLGRSVTSIGEYSNALQFEAVGILKDSFREVLNINFTEGALTPGEDAEKTRLIKEKYSTEDWNVRGKCQF